MKTSTVLHECDVCGQKRVDGALVPEGWTSNWGFELVCGNCDISIGRYVDQIRGERAGNEVQLAKNGKSGS
jgi:hypothetical protein